MMMISTIVVVAEAHMVAVGPVPSAYSVSLRKVNALKISASDTDMGEISAIGTDM